MNVKGGGGQIISLLLVYVNVKGGGGGGGNGYFFVKLDFEIAVDQQTKTSDQIPKSKIRI